MIITIFTIVGGSGVERKAGSGEVGWVSQGPGVVSFPDPAFTLDKGLAHFARNLGLADSVLPEIWRTNQIAYTC